MDKTDYGASDREELCRAVARAVRASCVQTALEQGEDARMAGLCWEGAWEVAIGAMEALDLEAIVRSCVLSASSHK